MHANNAQGLGVKDDYEHVKKDEVMQIKGWSRLEDLPRKFQDQRLILLLCCFRTKPRIEINVWSNRHPGGLGEMSVVIERLRAIQRHVTPSWGRMCFGPQRCCSGLQRDWIAIFRQNGTIAGGPNMSWNWDITRKRIHMTPVAPLHSQANDIWASGQHGGRGCLLTLVVGLYMFTEECEATVHQAQTGVLLSSDENH
eukprot:5227867-Amphidinium_carterae.2